MQSLSRAARTHIHGGVDLSNSFILCGELINLHAITDQLTHDLDLQLVQFAPVHSIRLRNDGDDVHLYGNIKKRKDNMRKNDGQRNSNCSSDHMDTLLSSFFIVTRSRDFRECPLGAMKYKQAWILVSWQLNKERFILSSSSRYFSNWVSMYSRMGLKL